VWPKAIPQFNVAHLDTVQARRPLQPHPSAFRFQACEKVQRQEAAAPLVASCRLLRAAPCREQQRVAAGWTCIPAGMAVCTLHRGCAP